MLVNTYLQKLGNKSLVQVTLNVKVSLNDITVCTPYMVKTPYDIGSKLTTP